MDVRFLRVYGLFCGDKSDTVCVYLSVVTRKRSCPLFDFMKKREFVLIAVLTILIAFMDLTVIPSVLLFTIQIGDIEPAYFSLMINFLLIGIITFLYL